MSGGFIPAGYVPLKTFARENGLNDVGSALAGGDLKAFIVSHSGDLRELFPSVWLSWEGPRLLETGERKNPYGGPGEQIVVKTPSQPLQSAGAWAPDGRSLSSWVIWPPAVAEAERRLRSAGVNISEAATCKALEVMWRESGLDVSDESIGRIRRAARQR